MARKRERERKSIKWRLIRWYCCMVTGTEWMPTNDSINSTSTQTKQQQQQKLKKNRQNRKMVILSIDRLINYVPNRRANFRMLTKSVTDSCITILTRSHELEVYVQKKKKKKNVFFHILLWIRPFRADLEHWIFEFLKFKCSSSYYWHASMKNDTSTQSVSHTHIIDMPCIASYM